MRLTRAVDQAVAGVDGRGLADLHVLGLRLGDLELRFEMRRVGDASQVRAGRHLLADVDGTTCSTPATPARTCSSSTWRCFELHDRPRLIDFGLLHGQPRLHRLGVARELLLGNRQRAASWSASSVDCLTIIVETSALAASCSLTFDLQRRLLVVGFDARGGRFLGERLVAQLHAQVGEAASDAFELERRVLAAPARAAGCSARG